MECIICKLEIADSVPYHYHEECLNCIYCGKAVGFSLAKNLVEDGESVYHAPCHDHAMLASFQERPVTITQGKLDWLNKINLMFEDNLGISIKGNQYDAECKLHQVLNNVDLNDPDTMDRWGIRLKRMEAITATLSIILSKQKGAIQIRAEERDRARFEEVKEIRSAQGLQKIKKAEGSRKATERLDPIARARMNSIKMLMSLGMSEADATESLNKGKIQ